MSFLRDLVEEMSLEQRIAAAADQYYDGIILCMTTEGVTLEAAITSAQRFLEHQLKMRGVSDNDAGLTARALNMAADNARASLEAARRLVQAEDDGSSEPVALATMLAAAAASGQEI
jgi:hypothetical protein